MADQRQFYGLAVSGLASPHERAREHSSELSQPEILAGITANGMLAFRTPLKNGRRHSTVLDGETEDELKRRLGNGNAT